MVAPGRTFGQVGGLAALEWDSRLFWYTVALAGALLVGALIIAFVDRWRKRPVQVGLSPKEQLAHFQTLYNRGELSAEEFNRVRALLLERIKNETEPVLAPPVAGPSQAAPPPDGPLTNGPPPAPGQSGQPPPGILPP